VKKITKAKRDRGEAQEIEPLPAPPNQLEAQSSNPSTAKGKKKREEGVGFIRIF
jgi:hypothetical protein